MDRLPVDNRSDVGDRLVSAAGRAAGAVRGENRGRDGIGGDNSLPLCRWDGARGIGRLHATRTTLRTPRVDRLLCRRDGCDVGAIPAVPRVGGAIWGRDRIDEGPGGTATFPCPGHTRRPPKDACRAEPSRTGEAASAAGQYPQCPGSIGPSGAAIVLPGLRPSNSPYPQCPGGRTSSRPRSCGGGCNAGAIPQCPGSAKPSGAETVFGSAPALRPLPTRSSRSAPEGCAWGRLWCRATAATWVRCLHNAAERGPIRGRDRIGQAPTVGHPTTRVLYSRSAPDEGRALECGLAGRQGRGRRRVRRDGICGGGERDFERPGPFHTLDAPGLLGRPVGARTGAGAAG